MRLDDNIFDPSFRGCTLCHSGETHNSHISNKHSLRSFVLLRSHCLVRFFTLLTDHVPRSRPPYSMGERAQYVGVLFLIWGCTCSTICLLFPVQPLLRTSYLITSTFIFTSSTNNLFGSSLDAPALDISFPYLCARFGLLSCVPALHDLVTRGENVGLAAEFLYMSVRNTLCAGMYMICSCNPMDWRVLPRLGQIIM